MQCKLILLLFLLSSQVLISCDICGSNPSSMYIGLLPNYTSHFFGLKHRFVKFNTIHSDRQEFGQDVLNEMTIWGRYTIFKKFQLYGYIPYVMNERQDNHTSYTIHGLGDMSVSGQYTLFDNSDSMNSKLYHILQSGVGLKLPTGQSDIIANGNTVIPMLQLGTGSVDVLTNIFYMLRAKKVGLSIDGTYKWNTTGSQNYRMGNSFNLNLKTFYWYQMPKLAWIPNVGLGLEQFNSNVKSNVLDTLTGGLSLLSSLGINLFWKNISIGTSIQIPIYQKINLGYTESSVRISSQINYFINRKKNKKLNI